MKKYILLAAIALAGCKTDDFLASPTGRLVVAAATGAATRATQSAIDQSSGKKINQKKVALDAAAGALDAVKQAESQPLMAPATAAAPVVPTPAK